MYKSTIRNHYILGIVHIFIKSETVTRTSLEHVQNSIKVYQSYI